MGMLCCFHVVPDVSGLVLGRDLRPGTALPCYPLSRHKCSPQQGDGSQHPGQACPALGTWPSNYRLGSRAAQLVNTIRAELHQASSVCHCVVLPLSHGTQYEGGSQAIPC